MTMRMTTPRAVTAVSSLLLVLVATPGAAQTAGIPFGTIPRGFVSVNAGGQAATGERTDQFAFQANAETGSIEARYPSASPFLFDGSVGYRFAKRIGLAAGFSYGSSSGTTDVTASVPHPLYDDQDRIVEGQAGGATRTEAAGHLQLFYDVPLAGRWHLRLMAGPSYVRLEQDLVHDVTVNETFPYDTATFDTAVTSRGKGSGIGYNAGADVTWMFARRVGAGLLVRYTRAQLDLDAPGGRTVSLDAGGVQAGAGLRFLFAP